MHAWRVRRLRIPLTWSARNTSVGKQNTKYMSRISQTVTQYQRSKASRSGVWSAQQQKFSYWRVERELISRHLRMHLLKGRRKQLYSEMTRQLKCKFEYHPQGNDIPKNHCHVLYPVVWWLTIPNPDGHRTLAKHWTNNCDVSIGPTEWVRGQRL